MSKPAEIVGWDYTAASPQPVKHTLEHWKGIVSAVLKDGGRRRVEAGETFLHSGTDGRLLYEAWANIPAPKE